MDNLDNASVVKNISVLDLPTTNANYPTLQVHTQTNTSDFNLKSDGSFQF